MNIIRLQSQILENALQSQDSRDVFLVQGARQVGKTTLIESCLRKMPKVLASNLEKDADFLRAIDRTSSFDQFTKLIQSHFKLANFDAPGVTLFVDEAQESDKLGSYIRFMKEEWQHAKVIISGSSMSRIFRNTDRVPVGRYRPWIVTPLVFDEFLSASGHNYLIDLAKNFAEAPQEGLIDGATHDAFMNILDEYLTVGGLPEVVTTYFSGGDFQRKRTSIYDSQEDDFVRKSSLSDRLLFGKGLRGVANFIGMPSKYSHIYEHKKIAEKILSEEIAWNLIVEIEQKGFNATTQHLPKRYLYDLGMAQDLRAMPFPRLSLVSTKNPDLRSQLGGLFENAFLLQILSEQSYLGNISGWRRGGANGPEIDFVWRTNSLAIPLECKATQTLSAKHWSSLKTYLNLTEQKIGCLISASPFKVIRSKDKTLINLPLYLANLASIRKCIEQYRD